YSMMLKKVAKAERRKRAEEALALMRLPNFFDRKPAELSGGQRQRVALARAIVSRPKALLLDEPLGALDLKLRENMQEELKTRQRSLGLTFVFVTHDQSEALSMADRVAVFNDGKVVQVGPPQEIYRRPVNAFVADFVGSSNVLPPSFVQAAAGEARWASLRPEQIRLSGPNGADGALVGTVTAESYLGATTRYAVTLPDVSLHAIMPAGAFTTPGDGRVAVAFDKSALHFIEGPAG
ncbi:MAG: ABC transporter ATP-binding protein, partial [Hansschlegelia sp.]